MRKKNRKKLIYTVPDKAFARFLARSGSGPFKAIPISCSSFRRGYRQMEKFISCAPSSLRIKVAISLIFNPNKSMSSMPNRQLPILNMANELYETQMKLLYIFS